MSRDQRSQDNWALLFAQELALQNRKPLAVVFNLVPEFLGATLRQYGFMLRGLEELEKRFGKFNIPFFLTFGDPEKEIPKFLELHSAGALVSDFSPLRIACEWKQKVAEKIKIPFYEVDAHNIVPCWIASPKSEYGAYTFRPKIRRLLPEFLENFPMLRKQRFAWPKKLRRIFWKDVWDKIHFVQNVPEINWLNPGETSAKNTLKRFMDQKLDLYEAEKNDPTACASSDLSPYLHFGQISAARVALDIEKHKGNLKSKAAFLEELIVRKELADNFCFYQPSYDSFQAFPGWAQKTLRKHQKDKRPVVYSLMKLELAKTHDELWNACQRQLLAFGKMHGYMRMYWAKKILEWTKSPEEALEFAIFLNDRYELDGRDPNGYAGIAWSIGGVHDRPWFERPVFGQVRYMSFGGCKGKFDVSRYVEMHK